MFGTFGFWVVHLELLSQPDMQLPGGMTEGIEIASVVDFVTWFAALWGFQNLWAHLHTEVSEHGIVKHWTNPFRRASTLINATLCAFPFSYYAVLCEKLLTRGRMPEAVLSLMEAIAPSLAMCALVVCVLYASAVRFWPRYADQTGHSGSDGLAM